MSSPFFFAHIIAIFLLLFNQVCDIKVLSKSVMKGKIAISRPTREYLSTAESRCKVLSLGSPRSGFREEDGTPPLQGEKCPRCGVGIAGGTAEGEPFVPRIGEERLFIFLPGWR